MTYQETEFQMLARQFESDISSEFDEQTLSRILSPEFAERYGRRREFTEPENFFRLRYLGCMAHLSARNLDSALLDYGHNYNRERNSIVLDNLGLVYSTAIRFNPRSAPDKDDLVAEGTHSLIKAIDHFNPWRGYKFSTYATQSIINGLVRHREIMKPSNSLVEDIPHDPEPDFYAADLARMLEVLDSNCANLDEIEFKIIRNRFPLDPNREPSTYKELGRQLGKTIEGIRFIQNRSLRKLKECLN
jgi:RNA polymerase sigma factor (sigma-70 family)